MVTFLFNGSNPYLQFEWKLEDIPYDVSIFSETVCFYHNFYTFQCELKYGTQLSLSAVKQPYGYWTEIVEIICIVEAISYSMVQDKLSEAEWKVCFDVNVERTCSVNFHICLNENVPQYQHYLVDSQYCFHMWEAAQKKLLTDIKFEVEGKEIEAHRSILAARCPSILISYDKFIKQNDLTAETFSNFLRFVYTGQLMVAPNEDLRRLAKEFQLDTLAHLCSTRPEVELRTPRTLTRTRNKSGAIVKCLTGLSVKCTVSFQFLTYSTSQSQDFEFNGQKLFTLTLSPEVHKVALIVSSNRYSDLKLTKVFVKFNSDEQFKSMSFMLTKAEMLFSQDIFMSPLFKPNFTNDRVCIEIDVYAIPNAAEHVFQPNDILLPKDLWTLTNNKTFADLEFITEDRTFYVHRAVLAARSEHFSRMLHSGMIESITGQVHIPDSSAEVIEQLLFYLYTGSLPFLSDYNDLLVVADKYQIDSLVSLCEKRVNFMLSS